MIRKRTKPVAEIENPVFARQSLKAKKIESRKKRKNFFPTALLALAFWLGWGFILFKFPPIKNLTIALFLLLLFMAVVLTAALFFASSRRGFIFSCWIIGILLLRLLNIGNLLNLFLISALFLTLELYFSFGPKNK